MRHRELIIINKLKNMVDWNGLFKWSMSYQDGTKPSEFKAMSKEDRDWLEEAMKQYTFDDTNRLAEIVKALKAQGQPAQENDEVK